MANLFRRLRSFGSDSRNQSIVNSNEQRTGPIYRAPSPDNFVNWVMPRMDIDTLYKIGLFEFKKAYSVKTHEEAISLQNGMQSIGMISPIAIVQHYKSSLLAMIQTNVCKDPIFFNCYPNFMVDLTCPLTYMCKVMSFWSSKILL